MVRGVRRGDWSVKSVWEDMVELKSSRKGFCSALRIPWDLVCIEHGLKMKKVVKCSYLEFQYFEKVSN